MFIKRHYWVHYIPAASCSAKYCGIFFSNCCVTKRLVSMNLSTQLRKQLSVRPSSLDEGLSTQVSQHFSFNSWIRFWKEDLQISFKLTNHYFDNKITIKSLEKMITLWLGSPYQANWNLVGNRAFFELLTSLPHRLPR
jgi:hypothetical protein